MELRTLILNSSYMPHQIVSWRDAICLLYCEKKKVVVLEEYDETVSSPSTTLFIPAVMLLLKKSSPSVKKGVKFSRINVLTRDKFTCQYCASTLPMKDLNYDHVVPRKQGGKTVWENIATSCYDCNERKGGRTPDQAGMRLLRHPAKPSALPLHAVFMEHNNVPDAWLPYVNLNKIQQNGSGYYMLGYSATSS